MNDRAWRHPKVETMAAFVQGTLVPAEIAEIAKHLRDCRDCRTVVGETARFEVEEASRSAAEEAARQPRPRLRTRLWAVAAAAAAVISLSVPLIQRTAAFGPVSLLIDASPREYRRVEGRLSGFPWARLQASPRGGSQAKPEDLKLSGAAGKVLTRTANNDDPDARHAAGVAYLLVDQTISSIAELQRAATAANDARYWNDLATARLAVAVREERPSELAHALEAAHRALRIDPKLPEARFNLALILQQMKLNDAARQEWIRYLEIDPGSEWSAEAREQLRRVKAKPEAAFPRDLGAVPAFVRGSPQEARRQAENRLLPDWADAEASGNPAVAAARLQFVRTIGEALVAANGDAFVLDVVQEIDRADVHTHAALVQAHRRFNDARAAYAKREIGVAEAGFRQAETAFRATGSPMADLASYFAACAAANANRGQEAMDALTRLRARIDRARHRSLLAQIDWQLGVSSTEAADFGAAARWGTSAAEAFTSLGERKHAAFTEGIAAHALERIGASDLAWTRWLRAFEALEGHDPTTAERRRRLEHSAARAFAATDRVGAAETMLDVMFGDGTEENHTFLAEVLTDRARLAQRSGDLTVARRWLSEARIALDCISDPAGRTMANARIDIVDAAVRGAVDPRAAMAMLDRAVRFFEAHGKGLQLPDAYLERARAHRAADDDAAALSDYQAALAEIERQKKQAGDVQQAFVDTAGEIIDDMIALYLARGAVAQAFAIADRAHAMLAASSAPVVPPGVALIEYAVLPRTTVIFCVTANGITAQTVAIDRRVLGERVASLAHRIRGRESVENIRTEAAALHRLLVAPVHRQLHGIDEIVVVTDRQLHALPFALLFDTSRGRHLLEDYTIRFAPSAHTREMVATSALTPAVVFADPPTDLPRLPFSRDEAEKVAAMHGATLVTGAEATRRRFIEAVRSSALVHYAGHADSDAGQSYGALLLAASDGDHGILGAGDIARLPLRENAPLIVLSACGTFRGTPTHVAGMPSLARAFLTAGARAVVGTLWEVDDDLAASLFLRFHDHLRAGAAPARALRAAQIEMLQSSDPRLRHPSTWSAVEVLSNL